MLDVDEREDAVLRITSNMAVLRITFNKAVSRITFNMARPCFVLHPTWPDLINLAERKINALAGET